MTVQEAVVEGDCHTEDKWEYRRLRLPPGVSRRAATTQLSIHAEFAGWELSTVRLYADGTRRVWLRRKRTPAAAGLPGVIT
ncbi:DUF5703 family protein [Amycolatopsis anabasis]|uniref:DUF5703 family protein n=1 Tax=Amycolatopsis anabasis TaxID=1840409 RepID=UPI00131E78D1|nr:DUF5703 family protein [Amycolatopsis anabasis]